LRITILTGAGISADSGIATFRDADGLWENHRVEDVASPAAFRRDPQLVQRFYDLRREAVQQAEPNAAHRALAKLERELGAAHGDDAVTIITQNIDDLHERGGSRNVIHMHGELLSALCTSCEGRHRWKGSLIDGPDCPSCGIATLRPDIVWFGENIYHTEAIYRALEDCDVFAVIGTSGQVYPAAGLAAEAAQRGARTVLLNLESTGGLFDDEQLGPAAEIVPVWVDELLTEI